MSYEGNEEFWFRIAALSEAQTECVRRMAPAIETRPSRHQPSLFAVSFRLSPTDDYRWIDSFVRDQALTESTYGVFVSLVTSHDSEIVTMPQYILDLHRRIGGQMEFSFTVVSGSAANGRSDGP